MSIFYEFKDDLECFQMCIINIEDNYTQSLSIKAPDNILNPYKRLQYIAAREALLTINPKFPLDQIQVTPTGKPFVPDYNQSFSLSHSSNYAAALVSPSSKCGFDIELPGKKISSIRDKFISPEEYKAIERTLQQFFPAASEFIFYGICWSAKESVYKWLGRRDLNFRIHIELYPSENNFNTHIPHLNCKIKLEGEPEQLVLVYIQWQRPLVITWVLDSINTNASND